MNPWWSAVVSSWPLILIGFTGTVAALLTLDVIRRQTNAIEHQTTFLVNSQRPWVVVSRIWPLQLRLPCEFLFDIRNSGGTVARITDAGGYYEVLDSTESLPDIPPYTLRERISDSSEYGRVLINGDSMEKWPILLLLSDTEVSGVLAKKLNLFVYGFVDYFDHSGTSRELRFCYQWKESITMRSSESMGSPFVLGGPREYNKHT
jgi:hypothetical protein